MSELFEDLNNMYKKLKTSDPDKEITIWDAFTYLVREIEDPDILTLRVDIEVLKLVAEGNSLLTISKKTGYTSKHIHSVAFAWGMVPVQVTLDFNPLVLCDKETTPQSLLADIEVVSFQRLSLEQCRDIINNVNMYRKLVIYLSENERE